MNRNFAVSLLTAMFTALVACDRPGFEPEIEWGVSTCHRCSAIISQPGWAAADRRDGVVRLYDDPGCLFSTLRGEKSESRDAVFQDHLAANDWLDASEAWFGFTSSAKSPQGFGWAAYDSFAAAQGAVTSAGSGRIVRYAEVLRDFSPQP